MGEPDMGQWAHVRERSREGSLASEGLSQPIPHRALPDTSHTLVELGVAQKEGAIEDGQDPAKGQQVEDTDSAQ